MKMERTNTTRVVIKVPVAPDTIPSIWASISGIRAEDLCINVKIDGDPEAVDDMILQLAEAFAEAALQIKVRKAMPEEGS
jgi:hypothetical protein